MNDKLQKKETMNCPSCAGMLNFICERETAYQYQCSSCRGYITISKPKSIDQTAADTRRLNWLENLANLNLLREKNETIRAAIDRMMNL